MAERPLLLLYNMDAARRSKLLPAAVRMHIPCKTVERSQYGIPIGKLVEDPAVSKPLEAVPESFDDPMIVMAHFSGAAVNSFLNALRAAKMPPVALKAVLTETNAEWDSLQLHDQLLAEHRAMHQRKA